MFSLFGLFVLCFRSVVSHVQSRGFGGLGASISHRVTSPIRSIRGPDLSTSCSCPPCSDRVGSSVISTDCGYNIRGSIPPTAFGDSLHSLIFLCLFFLLNPAFRFTSPCNSLARLSALFFTFVIFCILSPFLSFLL